MTPETAPEFIPMVQALADRKTIQRKVDSIWMDDPAPTFEGPVSHWRVKPAPLTVWLNIYPPDGGLPDGCGEFIYRSKELAKKFSGSRCIGQRKFVEVEES